MDLKKASIFISLVLRHKPEAAGIALDEHGWANVDELLNGLREHGHPITMEQLEEIVRTDNKQRYSFSEDKRLIRANQGHSIPVDVELAEAEPPEFLFHGTATRFLPAITEEGLKPMSRLYVHLSKDKDTARTVGARHGVPAIITIRAGEMHREGYRFFLSENGVWLTKEVPSRFFSDEIEY